MKYVIEVQDEFDGSLDSIVILRKRGMGGVVADGIPKDKLTPLNFEYVKEHFGLIDDEVHALRQSVADEVWAAAKKIFALDDLEAEKCGLDDVDGMTAFEAIAKLKAYEEKKADDEIKVGDIIRCKDDHSVEAYVTFIDDNMRNFSGFAINEVRNVCSIGGLYYDRPLLHWEKTGRHVSFSNIINKMHQ